MAISKAIINRWWMFETILFATKLRKGETTEKDYENFVLFGFHVFVIYFSPISYLACK